jgi:hypothetical protein
MTMTPTESEPELNQLNRVFDNMLTSAEINIRNRPYIHSFKEGRAIFLVIPTLEDLKSTMFESGDLEQEIRYPLKITTKDDIESAAILANSPPGTVGHCSMIPTIVSRTAERVAQHIHSFTEECTSHGGTIAIFDADGLTKLSLDGLLRKYYR